MNSRENTDEFTIEEPVAIYGEKKGKPMGPGEMVACIRAGLPMVEFEALQKLLGLGAEELAGHLSISRSTLIRRRKSRRLDPQESDRLLRYARLYARAETTLGDAEAAQQWLKTPARALGYESPLHFAETEAGAREVDNLLGRIEHGVFS
ncbi:type II RES/Xre toxin-antitoxin system antitoxin [Coraliomargarita sp. W4R53]